MAQMKVMDIDSKATLAGCAFAHEGLADGMMLALYRVMKANAQAHQSKGDEFERLIYPYFSEHGDYKAMAAGKIGVNDGDGVEAEHARRERDNLEEVLAEGPQAAEDAYQGAKAFIARQEKLWGSMQTAIQQAASTQSHSPN